MKKINLTFYFTLDQNETTLPQLKLAYFFTIRDPANWVAIRLGIKWLHILIHMNVPFFIGW
jgi:hypothetical protein